jgi:hypothetical protein
VTEIEADEVGASLKWTTAKVERTPSAATTNAPKGGSGRPNAAGTSTTRLHFDSGIGHQAEAPGLAGGLASGR